MHGFFTEGGDSILGVFFMEALVSKETQVMSFLGNLRSWLSKSHDLSGRAHAR